LKVWSQLAESKFLFDDLFEFIMLILYAVLKSWSVHNHVFRTWFDNEAITKQFLSGLLLWVKNQCITINNIWKSEKNDKLAQITHM
jgi:hypothetical protein